MFGSIIKLTTIIVSLILVASACGGGGDDFSVEVTGQISGGALTSLTRDINTPSYPALPDHTICCFSGCGVSDSTGFFSFNADASAFPGGDVLCTLTDPSGIRQEFILTNIVSDPSLIEVQVVLVDGQIVSSVTNQSSNEITSPSLEPSPAPSEESPTDEVKNACKLLTGSYTGNGGCGIGTTVMVNQDPANASLSLTNFGDNGTTSFYYFFNDNALSYSSDLDLFGKGGHSCTISCKDSTNTSFSVACNSQTGACTEIFQ